MTTTTGLSILNSKDAHKCGLKTIAQAVNSTDRRHSAEELYKSSWH